MPYEMIAAGGKVHRIGSAGRAILEAMVNAPLDPDGIRRMARSDLVAAFHMGQRGESGRSAKDLAINRLISGGALRRGLLGYRQRAKATDRWSEMIELTPVGLEIATALGLAEHHSSAKVRWVAKTKTD